MKIEEIKEKLNTPECDFLLNNEHLKGRIFFLTLAGSHAYGMETENSDVDIRGIAFNTKEEILLGKDFGEVENKATDTVVYSFNKIIPMFAACNPNVIEQLGCLPEHYLYLNPTGKALIENRKMFLSQKCIHTFTGYATAQLRRLENKSARLVGQAENEAHILKSIENAKACFPERYFPIEDGCVDLYIDNSDREGYEKEIFMDINLKHYPLRDWADMWSQLPTT